LKDLFSSIEGRKEAFCKGIEEFEDIIES